METLRRRLSVPRNLALISLFIGACIGVAIGWLTDKPPPTWMHFETFRATYVLGSKVVRLSGVYEVTQICDDNTLIWRTEILATDGQIALYGPKADAPMLTEGWHQYDEDIMLLRPILEDGWVARAIVTCPDERPDTVVSPPAVVTVHEPPLR